MSSKATTTTGNTTSKPKRSKRSKLKSEAREIVCNVWEKCSEEKLLGKLKHPLNHVTDRVVEYTNISKSTIHRIRCEKEQGTSGKFITPDKKRMKKKKYNFDNFDMGVLRRLVQEFYLVRKELPTLKKLRIALRDKNISVPGKETLRKLMHENGFLWKKTRSNKEVLMETASVIEKRAKYLIEIEKYRNEKRNLVYVDETWVDSNVTNNKCWQHPEVDSPFHAYSPKHEIIVVNACTPNGFVQNASLVYTANKASGDYHGQMNYGNFLKWVTTKLIPNLEANSVVIMDNASYHSVLLDKVPTKSALKSTMMEWLIEKNIPCSESMRKYELFALIESNKPDVIQYKIDTIIRRNGHDVLRLPPYMAELNLIEFVWAVMKRRIREVNVKGEFSMEELRNKTEEAMNSIEPSEFLKTYNHIVKIENTYRKNDALCENRIDEVIVELGGEEESDDEFMVDEPEPMDNKNESDSDSTSTDESNYEDDVDINDLATPITE